MKVVFFLEKTEREKKEQGYSTKKGDKDIKERIYSPIGWKYIFQISVKQMIIQFFGSKSLSFNSLFIRFLNDTCIYI